MQQQRNNQGQQQRLFTAAEVAQYEYCPLVWWHEQFDPLVQGDTEDLFAQMVEMEHAHGPQATALPDYQVLEQVLVRRGAFEEGHKAASSTYREQEDNEEVIVDEQEQVPQISKKMIFLRNLSFAALGAGIVLLLLASALGFVIGR
jgi:hypothetical protein